MEPEEREDVQKKTFGKWINFQLARHKSKPAADRVTDLYYDLRDGHVLLDVLEVLTNKSYKREQGTLRVHNLANAGTVLNVLRDHDTKFVNINSVDLVDGNPKITLALVWTIISRWNWKSGDGSDSAPISIGSQTSNLDRTLLQWCQNAASTSSVQVDNFTSSFGDGMAFAAILHHFRPSVVDMEWVQSKTRLSRLDYCFKLYGQAGIPRLLDPEDICSQTPDKKSVMTFMLCAFHVLDGSLKPSQETLKNSSANNGKIFFRLVMFSRNFPEKMRFVFKLIFLSQKVLKKLLKCIVLPMKTYWSGC